jgi:flagellar hook protein FlgE
MSQSSTPPVLQGADDVGLGTTDQATALDLSQGIIQNTDRNFDLAIQGKGFFGVMDSTGTMNYTRNGAMYVDGKGYLVDQNGNYVLGQKAPGVTINADLTATTSASDVQPTMSSPGKQEKIQIPIAATNPGKPGTPAETTNSLVGQFTYSKGTVMPYSYYVSADTVPTITVTDLNGVEQGKIYLDPTKKGNHDTTWDGKVSVPAVGADGKPVLNSNGQPTYEQVTLDSGQYIFNNTYVSKVAVPAIPPGNFAQYNIDSNGKIIAQFDNGMSSTIAQIPVYQFQNEQGLTKVGDSLYQQSDNSGTAFFDKDSKGNYSSGGTIMSNALEMSNVSLASAMTQLLITQKAFDASAKCVTTSDQMIQKAIAMPR